MLDTVDIVCTWEKDTDAKLGPTGDTPTWPVTHYAGGGLQPQQPPQNGDGPDAYCSLDGIRNVSTYKCVVYASRRVQGTGHWRACMQMHTRRAAYTDTRRAYMSTLFTLVWSGSTGETYITLTTPLSGLVQHMRMCRTLQDAVRLRGYEQTQVELRQADDASMLDRLDAITRFAEYLLGICHSQAASVFHDRDRNVDGSNGSLNRATVEGIILTASNLRKIYNHLKLIGGDNFAAEYNLKAVTTLFIERFFSIMRTRWNDDNKDVVAFVHAACRHTQDLMRQGCAATSAPRWAPGLEPPPSTVTGAGRRQHYADPNKFGFTFVQLMQIISSSPLFTTRGQQRQQRRALAKMTPVVDRVPTLTAEEETAIQRVRVEAGPQRQQSTRGAMKSGPGKRPRSLSWMANTPSIESAETRE